MRDNRSITMNLHVLNKIVQIWIITEHRKKHTKIIYWRIMNVPGDWKTLATENQMGRRIAWKSYSTVEKWKSLFFITIRCVSYYKNIIRVF